LLSDIPELESPFEPEWARSNWQSVCVRLPAHCSQRLVMQRMLDDGVSTRRGIMCSHREPPYRDLPPCWPLAQSERAQEQCILLPLYHQMTEADQAQVVDSLKRACHI
jgi:perosamine synthetase